MLTGTLNLTSKQTNKNVEPGFEENKILTGSVNDEMI